MGSHRSVRSSEGAIVAGRGSQGGGFVAGGTEDRRGAIARGANDDVYVGRDGSVYRRDDDGWSQYDGGEWRTLDTSTANQVRDRAANVDRGALQERASGFDRSAPQGQITRELNRDSAARLQGATRSQNFSNVRSSGAMRSRGGIRRRR